jgi:hypothetical protein
MREPMVGDSVTRLGPDVEGRVVVCGSHGGLYAAWLAARLRPAAIVFHDAGIGRNSAGIAGVAWLDGLGIAACAIDFRSARIGDAADMLANGRVSATNELAARNGCLPGHTCAEVVKCLQVHAEEQGPPPVVEEIPGIGQSRIRIANTGHRPVWALDSATLAIAEDRRAILVTGSHGGLLGGKPEDGVLPADVFAALFNDAGGGKDESGYARLAVLDAHEVAAATVSCNSARIGDGRSTYETGVLSRINENGKRLELKEGMSAREAVARLVGLG